MFLNSPFEDQESTFSSFPEDICYLTNHNRGCNHWNNQFFTYANATYSAVQIGDFITRTANFLEALGCISIVCCLITIITYFIWRPLRCYSRKLIVIYAVISLYFDIVIIHVKETNIVDGDSCKLSDDRCLWNGVLINFGYSSLCAWTVVIFIQIFRMARYRDADEPGVTHQLIAHIVVWGSSACQALIPYCRGVIGYIGRPPNHCGYCFWDNGSIEFYGTKFNSRVGPDSSDGDDGKDADIKMSPKIWLWMAGTGYAVVCLFLMVLFWVLTGLAVKRSRRDQTLVQFEKAELELVAQIQRRKLSAITLMHLVISLSILVRAIWTTNADLVYDDGHHSHCRLTAVSMPCVPDLGAKNISLSQIHVLYNRDTSIMMVFEASIGLFAGILNFLLFCLFSNAFTTCFKLWLRNLFTQGRLFLSVDPEELCFDSDDDASRRGESDLNLQQPTLECSN